MAKDKTVGLVVAGAAARGAYEAGAHARDGYHGGEWTNEDLRGSYGWRLAARHR